MLSAKSKVKYDVKTATEILRTYGLSSSIDKTWRLIREGKLLGIHAGNNPKDKRAGYTITEEEIYNFVIREIPALSEYIKEIARLKKQIKQTDVKKAMDSVMDKPLDTDKQE